jgi:hypothetical protein
MVDDMDTMGYTTTINRQYDMWVQISFFIGEDDDERM